MTITTKKNVRNRSQGVHSASSNILEGELGVWPQPGGTSTKFRSADGDDDCSTIYAVSEGKNVLFSNSFGQQWTMEKSADGFKFVKVGAKGGDVIFVPASSTQEAIAMFAKGKVAYSTKNILNISNSEIIALDSEISDFGVSFDTGQFVVALTKAGIQTSNDFGHSFHSTHSIAANFSGITSDGSGRHWVAVTSDRGIFHSSTFGASWTNSRCYDKWRSSVSCSRFHFSRISMSQEGRVVVALVGQRDTVDNDVIVGDVFKSSDYGHSFGALAGSPLGVQWSDLCLSRNGTYLVTTVSNCQAQYPCSSTVFHGLLPTIEPDLRMATWTLTSIVAFMFLCAIIKCYADCRNTLKSAESEPRIDVASKYSAV